MTPAELREQITKLIAEDGEILHILERIAQKSADFGDSQNYMLKSGEISGAEFAKYVCGMGADERSAAVFGILWDRYKDGCGIFGGIQAIIDEKQGVHVAAQYADFPEVRAQKMANALSDPEAGDETIKRRAESAGNIVAAMHDDNVKANAEFRSRAGFTVHAQRIGGAKCCEWCASVTGKYAADDTPQGFWGRHDNCKCTILYDSRRGRQTLRGTGKRWAEQPAEDAGAAEPVTLTAEQAKKLQEKHQLKELTNDTERDRIIIREPILARRERNIGAFSELEMPMQKRTITRICKLYGIDISELRFKIQRDPHFLELQDDYFGSTDYDDIGRIDLFPKAFTNEEQLVRTILHEKLHVLQLKKHGKEYSLQNLNEMEKQARKYENVMYTQLRKKVKR